ncbi:hypothetical protein LINPERHAP1_LOCUS89 [Linum perenne]
MVASCSYKGYVGKWEQAIWLTCALIIGSPLLTIFIHNLLLISLTRAYRHLLGLYGKVLRMVRFFAICSRRTRSDQSCPFLFMYHLFRTVYSGISPLLGNIPPL